jgi:hypothetical protein
MASIVWGITPSFAAHQNDKVCHLSASCTHHGKCRMARCIKECNIAFFGMHHVSTDVLCNTTVLSGHNVCIPYGIQELGLTMVDMTHDGHDRRPMGKITTWSFSDSMIVSS